LLRVLPEKAKKREASHEKEFSGWKPLPMAAASTRLEAAARMDG